MYNIVIVIKRQKYVNLIAMTTEKQTSYVRSLILFCHSEKRAPLMPCYVLIGMASPYLFHVYVKLSLNRSYICIPVHVIINNEYNQNLVKLFL